MNKAFMHEYYENLRADDIEKLAALRNDDYADKAREYEAAQLALLEGLGLAHLFDHSHQLTPKEKVPCFLTKTRHLAPQKEFESPTFRLGVAPIRHREVTSDAKKCLEIQGFSAFQIPSDTTL